MASSDHTVMPLGQHLEELRRRLIFALLGLVPILVLSLAFGKAILGFLVAPAKRVLRDAGFADTLLSTGPLEVFNTYFHVSLIVTVALGAPWILYQLWRFVAPGLYARERRFVYLLLPLSTALVIAGTVFLFRVVMPMVLAFLVTFGADVGAPTIATRELPEGVTLARLPILDADPTTPAPGEAWINRPLKELRVCVDAAAGARPVVLSTPLTRDVGVRPEYRVSEYVKLLLSLSLAFAGGFQLPVVVLLLGWAGIIDPAFLARYRRHAILGCAIVAAVLTPGDISSMVALFVPLLLLYELGVALLKFLPASRVASPRRHPPREPASAGDP